MTVQQMQARILQAYPDASVEVVDLTGTEDHYQVKIVSNVFANKPRIHQHQMVMAIFDKELKSGEVHALTIKTEIPK